MRPSSPPHRPEHHFLRAGDSCVFFTDDGSGKTLLLIHGWACDSNDWIEQIPILSPHHRVIAPDLVGHGRSSVRDCGYGPSEFADDLAILIERLDCAPPVVAIGHSLGGVVASVLAVKRPDLVRAVVEIDPALELPIPNRRSAERICMRIDREGPRR